MGEGIEGRGGGRGGLDRARLVPRGDVASAERRHPADGDRGLPECRLRDDGRAAPGGNQGQDGGELDTDVPDGDRDGGLGCEPPQGVVTGGAGRPGHPGPPGQVGQAAGLSLPVRRDDQEIGVEGEVAQAEAGLGGRGTGGVVLGDHDVQVAEAQIGHGSRPIAFGDDGLDSRARGDEIAQRGADQRTHDALEGRDPHRAGRLAGQLGQVPFCLADLGGDALAVGCQQPPGRGQPYLPARSVDEAGTGLPLQGQQLLGDRRRAQVQRAGGGGDTAAQGTAPSN
ncbi:MAG TPA: hypothetical protein VFW50_44095 [Streptosporangiaceae bacterium]|nr:hypothetical protein [Streptosporangiaceae bacterium]